MCTLVKAQRKNEQDKLEDGNQKTAGWQNADLQGTRKFRVARACELNLKMGSNRQVSDAVGRKGAHHLAITHMLAGKHNRVAGHARTRPNRGRHQRYLLIVLRIV